MWRWKRKYKVEVQVVIDLPAQSRRQQTRDIRGKECKKKKKQEKSRNQGVAENLFIWSDNKKCQCCEILECVSFLY